MIDLLEDVDDVQKIYTNAIFLRNSLIRKNLDKGKYRILGIDPGSRIAGYALVDSCGNKMDLIDFGTVKLNHGHDGEKLNQYQIF